MTSASGQDYVSLRKEGSRERWVGHFPGKFEWDGPANFNVPVPKTMPKARSQLLESHEGGASSSPLAPNLRAISRCVLILP